MSSQLIGALNGASQLFYSVQNQELRSAFDAALFACVGISAVPFSPYDVCCSEQATKYGVQGAPLPLLHESELPAPAL